MRWSDRSDRPAFDLVTDVSTGTLTAPMAFLGPAYDAQLRHVYTDITPDKVLIDSRPQRHPVQRRTRRQCAAGQDDLRRARREDAGRHCRRLDPNWADARRQMPGIGGRAISTMITAAG